MNKQRNKVAYADFDEREARKPHPVKFTPRRQRGPAAIRWPLDPEQAVMRLTGRDTAERAFASYKCFFNARRAHCGKRPLTTAAIRERVFDGPWSGAFFVSEAQDYCSPKFRRKGFNPAKQKERIAKVFLRLGIKLL